MSNLNWTASNTDTVVADLGDQADAQAWMSITKDTFDGQFAVLFEQVYDEDQYDYEPVGSFATLDEAKAAAQAWADNPTPTERNPEMDKKLTAQIADAPRETVAMDWADGLAAWLWAVGAETVVIDVLGVTAELPLLDDDSYQGVLEALTMDPRVASVVTA